jgi:hypothetical protein
MHFDQVVKRKRTFRDGLRMQRGKSKKHRGAGKKSSQNDPGH